MLIRCHSSSPITIDIIVERQFFVLKDSALCKDTHPYVVSDEPLGNVAVWIAAVIRESTDSSLPGGINKLCEEVEIRSINVT